MRPVTAGYTDSLPTTPAFQQRESQILSLQGPASVGAYIPPITITAALGRDTATVFVYKEQSDHFLMRACRISPCVLVLEFSGQVRFLSGFLDTKAGAVTSLVCKSLPAFNQSMAVTLLRDVVRQDTVQLIIAWRQVPA